MRLGDRTATIVGVLEPSVPYPSETEIIANVVTSPHHLSATMVDGRVHRMTELFGRLAPNADLETARAELRTIHAAMLKDHPESYPKAGDFRIEAVGLRDQITSSARTVLLVLLAASALVFVIACSNVANLILARSVRRQGELAIRAALGASSWALRRTLLAESLLLVRRRGAARARCWRGRWSRSWRATRRVSRSARSTSRSTPRCCGSAPALAVAPPSCWRSCRGCRRRRPPTASVSTGGNVRITSGTNRRLRAFAVTQIAASFVLLAGAGMLLTALVALAADRHRVQDAQRPRAERAGRSRSSAARRKRAAFYKEALRRIGELPGVERVAIGTIVPWRDAGGFGPGFQFTVEGYAKGNGEEDPRGRFRTVSPGFFAALGVPIVAGRDFNDGDRRDADSVVIVSQSLARRMFPNQDALNRQLDVDRSGDEVHRRQHRRPAHRRHRGRHRRREHRPGPALAVYHPFEQEIGGGRLFVHARTDPYALVPSITRIIRDLSADQPVERAATLDDIRAEVLAPDRLERAGVRRVRDRRAASSRLSASPACWRSRSARARGSSASGWRSARRRATC